MRTAHLLAVTGPILAVLAFVPAVPVLSPVLCLTALGLLGELWLRALVREPLTPTARLGLSAVAGLMSLPLVALVLHALSLRIEVRALAAGVAVLAVVLGVVGGKGGPSGHVDRPCRVDAPCLADAPCPVESLCRADSPHPGHWVGRVEHTGTTRTHRLSTVAAVGVPTVLALLIGGTATVAYQRLPHPAEPGYTSLALAGWAAGIARPVAIPAGGLVVPLEVSRAGEQPGTASLQVRIGDRPAAPARPVTITAGTSVLRVHVPAPADGCLHAIRISVGAASTVFYGRGPHPARDRTASDRTASDRTGRGSATC